MNTRKTAGMAVAVVLLAVVMVSSASAAVIQIQLGGVGLQYDGATIVDKGPVNPDTLSNATFFLDDTLLGSDTDKVTLDLNIPGVPNMLVGGETVYSQPDQIGWRAGMCGELCQRVICPRQGKVPRRGAYRSKSDV